MSSVIVVGAIILIVMAPHLSYSKSNSIDNTQVSIMTKPCGRLYSKCYAGCRNLTVMLSAVMSSVIVVGAVILIVMAPYQNLIL
jgi:hypothetical protein